MPQLLSQRSCMTSPINLDTIIQPTNNRKTLTPGTIYCTSDPEFVGVIPIRQHIEIIPGDTPVGKLFGHNVIVITSKNKIEKNDSTKSLLKGWTVTETIGVGIVNARAVSKLTMGPK